MEDPAATARLNKREKQVKALTEQNSAIKPTASSFLVPMLSRDELLLIDGIDPTAEMELNSIGIRKFSDFRGYTAETLAQALRRAGSAIAVTTIADQNWIEWAELHAAEAEKKEEEANDEIVLSIEQARFQQFERPATANAAATRFLRSEIDCCIAETKALRVITDSVPLCMQIFAVDMATEEYKLMASHLENLLPAQQDYHFQLEFAAPPVGRYHLKIVAFLLAANHRIAFHPGPLLRVVP